jgi:hypothetical protein
MLFFKSAKKTEAENSSAVLTRPPRYECLATVSINGYEGLAVLRNVSESGFRMESKTFVEIETGSSYVIRISPEPFTGVKPFEVTVEVRWAQSSPEKFSLGLMVIQTNSRSFQRYVDYLRSRAQKAG